VLFRSVNGKERQVRARYVLACDGGTSSLRTRLGLEMEDLQFDEPWMVVDVLVNEELADRLPATNIQFCEPERPCSYIVGPGVHRRWEFMINADETPAGIQEPESIKKLLSRWLAPHEYVVWRASAYRFHALVLKTWRDGNVFFLGDAAHMTPPFMAQGMCQGIRDAANLVWKLAMVNRRLASPKLLDTYQQERLPHVRHTTLVTKQLGQVICERDPARAATRDADMLAEMAKSTGPVVRQSLIPGLAAGLLAPDDATGARGSLFPQPLVADNQGREALLDELTGLRFRVIAAAGVDLAPLQAQLDSWDKEAALPLVLARLAGASGEVGQAEFRDKQGILQEWLLRHNCKVVIVRPDHYVYGGAASVGDALEMLGALRKMLAG
jgi:hypothetical protein